VNTSSLPVGWTTATVRELCLPVETVRPELEPDAEFIYIDISAIDRDRAVIASPQRLLGADAPQRARQRVEAGDILMSTVRPNLRTIAVVPDDLTGQVASTGFCVIRPSPELAPRFLYYAILSEDFQRRVGVKARGVNYPAVRDDDVLDETIQLPPHAEQVRIVETVESWMRGIDDLQKMIRTAVVQAAMLRRGVLDRAQEGAVVSQQRGDEPAEKLLGRIRAARPADPVRQRGRRRAGRVVDAGG
jgi:type I restriction enzyme S subunit